NLPLRLKTKPKKILIKLPQQQNRLDSNRASKQELQRQPLRSKRQNLQVILQKVLKKHLPNQQVNQLVSNRVSKQELRKQPLRSKRQNLQVVLQQEIPEKRMIKKAIIQMETNTASKQERQ